MRASAAAGALLCAMLLACTAWPGASAKDQVELSRLSERKWEEIAEQWLDDEEPDDNSFIDYEYDEQGRRKRDANGKLIHGRPKQPKGGKTEMVFVTVTTQEKSATEEVARKWTDLLKTAATEVKNYVIEDNKILLVIEGGMQKMFEIKRFVLQQPETVSWEHSQQTTYAPGKTAKDAELRPKDDKDKKKKKKQKKQEKQEKQEKEKEAAPKKKEEEGGRGGAAKAKDKEL